MDDLEKPQGFPWLIIIIIVAITAVAGTWLMRARAGQDAAIAALQQQLTAEKAVLEQEQDKVFDLTKQLELLKPRVTTKEAQDQYNALAAEQRAQREKVKTLADRYNETVTKLHALQ